MSLRRIAATMVAGATLLVGVGASEARTARSGQTTITMLASTGSELAYQVLIPNFERVYPNITLNVTYEGSTTALEQLETTELAAGNAPDLLQTNPGCGTPTSACVLAKAGYLAPMVKARWTKRSLPTITSLLKYGQGLFAFEPAVSPYGVFTNDALFSRLGLAVPQTFAQLLALCPKARADGTSAVIMNGGGSIGVALLIETLAVATVYGRDPHFTAEMKAGSASFDGSAGWHQALQEFVEMNDAGCFQPGFIGTSSPAVLDADFAEGQGLMVFLGSNAKGAIDGLAPGFPYSFRLFPGGTSANDTRMYLNAGEGVSVNAHSTPAAQAAAQTFVAFIARPKQDALYAQVTGWVTQYQILHQQIPSFMSSTASAFARRAYVVEPEYQWWNPDVVVALEQDGIGVITGQETIDGILQAMDAAWKQGPSG